MVLVLGAVAVVVHVIAEVEGAGIGGGVEGLAVIRVDDAVAVGVVGDGQLAQRHRGRRRVRRERAQVHDHQILQVAAVGQAVHVERGAGRERALVGREGHLSRAVAGPQPELHDRGRVGVHVDLERAPGPDLTRVDDSGLQLAGTTGRQRERQRQIDAVVDDLAAAPVEEHEELRHPRGRKDLAVDAEVPGPQPDDVPVRLPVHPGVREAGERDLVVVIADQHGRGVLGRNLIDGGHAPLAAAAAGPVPVDDVHPGQLSCRGLPVEPEVAAVARGRRIGGVPARVGVAVVVLGRQVPLDRAHGLQIAPDQGRARRGVHLSGVGIVVDDAVGGPVPGHGLRGGRGPGARAARPVRLTDLLGL